MAESALRGLVPRPQEIVAPTRSWNPLNPAFRDTVSSAVSNLLGSSNIAGREGYDRSLYADMLTGSVDFVPGVSEAAGVGDVRREVSQGNYPGAALAGVATALGVVPVIGDAAAKAVRGLDMSQAARMQRAAEQGYTGPYYHGSARIDRVVESGKIDPRRATSGPMPFFTDNPELASSYARNKSDTSLPEGEYQDVFRVSPRDLGISGRTPIAVERSWDFLDDKTKSEIIDRSTRIGYEDLAESTGRIKLHETGVDATPSRSQYDYLMRTSARGNPLKALRELWVDSGNLYGEEEKLAEIYRLAGFPAKIDQSLAPWTEASGVLPAMLRMKNPLETDNLSEIRERVIPSLENAFKNSRARTRQFGADAWDKNTRYTPKQWVEQLKEDVAKGETSYVWTSIPDKITESLKNLGYDGILDVGGKGGGVLHRVAIPFSPEQVRSINAAFDPAKTGSANLMAGVGGAAVGLSALNQLVPRNEERRPD